MPGTTKKHRIEKFILPIRGIGPVTTACIVDYFEAYRGRSLPNFILRTVLNPNMRIPCVDDGRRKLIAKHYQEVYL